MRKIKEVLRLRYELDLDQRQIARSCSISVSTVHEYLRRAETAGVGWPIPADWNDTRLQTALFPATGVKGGAKVFHQGGAKGDHFGRGKRGQI